jgi:hypothetical protein
VTTWEDLSPAQAQRRHHGPSRCWEQERQRREGERLCAHVSCALLEALVDRAIRDGVAAWDARGPHADPLAAVEDHLRGSWTALAAEASLPQAATDALGSDRLAQLHGPLHQRVHALLEAGRTAEILTTDVPLPWQVRTWFALIHEAGRRRGDDDAASIEESLVVTLMRALGAAAYMSDR